MLRGKINDFSRIKIDELNHIMLLDNRMGREFQTLSPYFSAPDVSRPFAVSGYVGLLSPATSILSNYLYDKQPSTEKDTVCSKFNFVK